MITRVWLLITGGILSETVQELLMIYNGNGMIANACIQVE